MRDDRGAVAGDRALRSRTVTNLAYRMLSASLPITAFLPRDPLRPPGSAVAGFFFALRGPGKDPLLEPAASPDGRSTPGAGRQNGEGDRDGTDAEQ